VLGAPNRFHGIMLPKTRGPEEIREVSKLLDDLEKRAGWKYKIQIESLIETPHALIHAYEIATASDRMCGLVFGIADYAAILASARSSRIRTRIFTTRSRLWWLLRRPPGSTR